MFRYRRSLLAALVVFVLLALTGTQAALAAEPGTVSVRVEGFGGTTLLPETTVTTTTEPISFSGGTCPGTSAGGALYDAVHGNWLIREEPAGAELDGILGQELPALEEEGNYGYWLFVLNNEFAANGLCAQEVAPGADIVLVGQCYATGALCPTDPSAPAHVLTATAPVQSKVLVGEPVSEKIGSLNTATFEADTAPPAGTTLDAGSLSATPGADGTASLKFGTPGLYTLQAHAPDSAPSDPHTVCVYVAGETPCSGVILLKTPETRPTVEPAPYKGPYALVVDVTSLLSGHVYGHGKAPRLISGHVSSHSPVTSVSFTLKRTWRGRCFVFDGVHGRFAKARCAKPATPFKVSKEAAFSYLLPSKLGPGRYVLSVEGTDAAGNTVTLARGTSRVVFGVR